MTISAYYVTLQYQNSRFIYIAEQLKKIRKEKGLSQKEVADKLSMNWVEYNRIETGKGDPTMNITI